MLNAWRLLFFSGTQEIYTSYDANSSLEVKGAFLDLCKTFDRVWHEGLIYKIKSIRVKGDLLPIIEHIFIQKTTKSCSEWLTIKARVPQSSILVFFFFCFFVFFIYIY